MRPVQSKGTIFAPAWASVYSWQAFGAILTHLARRLNLYLQSIGFKDCVVARLATGRVATLQAGRLGSLGHKFQTTHWLSSTHTMPSTSTRRHACYVLTPACKLHRQCQEAGAQTCT